MSNSKKKFEISAFVEVECSVPILAVSFEEALEQSKSLSTSDFLKCKGEVMDWAHRITSITLDHDCPSSNESD